MFGLKTICWECDLEIVRAEVHSHQVDKFGLTKTRDCGDPNYFIERASGSKDIAQNLALSREEYLQRFHAVTGNWFFTSPPKGDGFVYFIKEADRPRVKIGFSKDIYNRVTDLQVSCSSELMLVGYFAGTRQDESELHRRFKNDRIHGEWFNLSDELHSYIYSLRGKFAWSSERLECFANYSFQGLYYLPLPKLFYI